MTTESVPKKMQPKYDEIVALTDAFCAKHLNGEYAELCRKLTTKLARKRQSPLLQGRATSWFGAILYTIARVNFLFDATQTPHMTAGDLCKAMGVSQQTASSKSKQIMDMFNIVQFEPEWTLPSLMDQNPLAWMIMVDGFITDARSAPRHIQEVAFEKGLIPYIPGEG